MYCHIFLFGVFAIFQIGACLPVEEKLEPVDLAYSCIKAKTYEENGAKSPILLIHGITDSRKSWDRVNLLLAFHTKRRVCAVDLRNHGDSPWNNRNDVEALAADIGHFLDEQGIKKVNLIGHSLGGKTSMHYALKNPDRVDSIVVEDIRPNTIAAEGVSQVTSYFEILKAVEESVPTGLTEDEAKKSIVNFLNKQLEEMGSKERVPETFSESIQIKLVDGKWRFKHNLKVLEDSLKNIRNFWTESTGLYSGPALFIYGTKSPFKVLEPVNLSYSCVKDETDEESEAKSPILLIHGIISSKKSWNNVNLLLASRTKRRVCAVDLRNHGDSPWNNRSDVEALAVDIGYFLDKQGIQKVNLIGHSLGGKTSMHYALKNPDRVDSIVVEDIRPNTRSGVSISQVISYFENLNAATESVPLGMTEDEAKKSIVNFLNKKLEEIGSKERLKKLSESLEIKLIDGKWRFKHNLKILAESLKTFTNFWTESSGLYNGPALFIYGTKSPYKVNEDKDNILKLFPNAELVPVDGASHVIHGLFREFDDAVIRFLNKVN